MCSVLPGTLYYGLGLKYRSLFTIQTQLIPFSKPEPFLQISGSASAEFTPLWESRLSGWFDSAEEAQRVKRALNRPVVALYSCIRPSDDPSTVFSLAGEINNVITLRTALNAPLDINPSTDSIRYQVMCVSTIVARSSKRLGFGITSVFISEIGDDLRRIVSFESCSLRSAVDQRYKLPGKLKKLA